MGGMSLRLEYREPGTDTVDCSGSRIRYEYIYSCCRPENNTETQLQEKQLYRVFD